MRSVKRWWNSHHGRIAREDLLDAADKAGIDQLDTEARDALLAVLSTTRLVAHGTYSIEVEGKEFTCPVVQAGLKFADVTETGEAVYHIWAKAFDEALHDLSLVPVFGRQRYVLEVID